MEAVAMTEWEIAMPPLRETRNDKKETLFSF
jgi:hypothetical protein